MSLRFSAASLALAALVGLLANAALTSAKPPDLPADQEVICAPDVPPAAGTAAVASPDVDVRAASAWCNALRTAQRCLLCGTHPLLALVPDQCLLAEEYEEAAAALLAGQGTDAGNDVQCDVGLPGSTPVSPPQGMPLPAPPRTEPAKNGFTCPYLRQEDARQHRTQPCPLATPSDVLGNLHKLEEAQKAMEVGNYYRDTGHSGSAAFYYEKARRLCPGSHYERLAECELGRLQENPSTQEGEGAEEQEPADPQRVGDLLSACQRAFHAGRYARAEELARRALALDGDAVVAHPLVYKEHLLANLAAKVGHPIVVCSGTAAESEDETPGCPSAAATAHGCVQVFARVNALCKAGLYAEAEQCALEGLALEPGNPALIAAAQMAAAHCRMRASRQDSSPCPSAEPRCTLRRPELPPVDPGVPAAMDKVLTTVGEPAEDKLHVTEQESSGAAEDAEPADPEVPDLYLEPSEAKPPRDQGSAACGPDWWRDLVDLLRTSACAEVDGQPLASRGCCRVPLGCMTGEVSWDSRGEHGSFSLTLQVFGTPDAGDGQTKQEKSCPNQTPGAAPR